MPDELQSLSRLIAEATVLAGGKHQCAELGHDWVSIGGRGCPYGECGDSQAVFTCRACGDTDYGEPGGPGHQWCKGEHFDCGRAALRAAADFA